MKVVFMGTPSFAIPTFQSLLQSDKHEVVGVYCQMDKKRGRGLHISYPPVKELAFSHNLTVYQPTVLNDPEHLRILKSLEPDVAVVVAYGRILPKEFLEIPKYGCINVHGSLLPHYRGAGPIQWSVLNGETTTGVTTMKIAEGLDTGDILLQRGVMVGPNETATELYDRLKYVGAELLMETLDRIDEIVPQPQNEADATYAPMLSKDMSVIDFAKDAQLVHNKIRGLANWPCAQTMLHGKMLKVFRSQIVAGNKFAMSGQILDDKQLIVACAEGTAVKLTEIQYENSRRMTCEDFLRGHRVEVGDLMGR